ncbi:A/G-specific adenine glycosylase [Lewinella marina]|uniref:Adenine DNA glycosylase n=1 Tax=Neolewinella marina TaxID=438751 RepID=A0A2G0CBT0_9BACT|nr:A/G-specific adenine glycosylase [Neolewinella marina]NJB87053.1 A/G-specific adenine glycosylase [Neolewinella marina]PHK97412.1 A/G-specific adenine glycosylase [Neolewinella marina]
MEQVDWTYFRRGLTDWYRPDRRPMPWKGDRSPYRIWLSEIILQQTRVAQGLPYFERFVAAYPTVGDLAAAPDAEVMKLWEGLGYYSRARNLLKAARVVANEHHGRFPDTYDGLLALPGVGPYTAAAIASFAFDRPVAVLDGNVFRILARYAGDATPIDTGPGRKHFQQLVDAALGTAPAAAFNQAIMDFGALVCTPRAADCPRCPLADHCRARAEGWVYELPVKGKKAERRDRYFHYLVVTDAAGRFLIHRREDRDIWRQLYQFPLLEAGTLDLRPAALMQRDDWPDWLPAEELEFTGRSAPYAHQLTHQRIGTVFHTAHWPEMRDVPPAYLRIDRWELERYALPRVITRYLETDRLTLDL